MLNKKKIIMSNECIICFENKNEYLLCDTCNKVVCSSCILQYKKFECCNCSKEYKEYKIKSCFDINPKCEEIIEKYIFYYVFKKYFFNQKINEIIDNYNSKIENQKYLRFGYIKNHIESIVVKRCFENNCKGVYYTNSNKCSICDLKICFTCEEKDHSPNSCNKEVLETLKEIQEKCKKCPYCFVYIHKTEGCNSMKCTNCGASFNWRNLEIDNKKINNEHYITILNKDLNNEFLNHFVDNKFIKNKETTNVFMFIKNKKYLNEFHKNNFLTLQKNKKNILKNIDKYKISYLYELIELLKQNTEESLDNIFDLINIKNCKKLFIETKKHEFLEKLFFLNENNFNQKKDFDIEEIKNFINDFNKENILLDKSIYTIKNGQIIIASENKTFFNKVVNIYKKNKYVNNGKIELLDEEQKIHAKNILHNILNYNICLNSSYAGSGKTFISLYTAYKLDLKNVIIICPNIIYNKWIEILEFYNYKNKFNYLCLTYQELYNKNFEQNNNLFKNIYKTQNKSIIEFSEYFLNFITEDTIFIIDEIHNSKKSSTICSKFIKELSYMVYISNGYILGLSATPLDKDSDIKFIFEKLNAVKKYKTIPLNQDKLTLIYKSPIKNIYDEFKTTTVENKTKKFNIPNESSDSDTSNDSSDSDEIYFSDELESSDEKLKSSIPPNVKFISNENNQKLINIMNNIQFLDNKFKKQFYSYYRKIIPAKDIILNNKIINLLKNLIKNYNTNPDEIYNDYLLFKNYNFYYPSPIKQSYMRIERVLKDEKFLKEYNQSTNNEFKNLMRLFIETYKLDRIYIDLKNIKYLEEIGLIFLNAFDILNGSTDVNIMHIISNISIFYVFGFTIEQIFNLCTNTLDYLHDILMKIILNKINYSIKFEDNKITHLSKLNYLELNLNSKDQEILKYAFTEVDVNTKTKINKNSLYFMSLIFKGLEQTETVYINYIFTLIEIFHPTNKYKIVVGVSFTNTINDFIELFKKNNFKHLYINGSIKNKTEIINKFQNDDDENILIVNMKSLNSGVDLDDKTGKKKRLVFIVPNFSLTSLIQFLFRFKRKDSVSEPEIYIINNHYDILRRLLNKYQSLVNFKFDIPSLDNIKTVYEEGII